MKKLEEYPPIRTFLESNILWPTKLKNETNKTWWNMYKVGCRVQKMASARWHPRDITPYVSAGQERGQQNGKIKRNHYCAVSRRAGLNGVASAADVLWRNQDMLILVVRVVEGVDLRNL